MAIDAWDEPLNFGGAKLVEGKQYTIELTNIIKKVKVVSGSKALAKKGVINKEYDELDAAGKKLVDDAPVEYWPLKEGETTPREKAKFHNAIIFQFREPETDTKFMYDAQFIMSYPDNYPIKTKDSDLRKFVERIFGMSIQGDEGFTWGGMFKKGDKFVATTYRKDGYSHLNIDSIIKAELAGPTVTNDPTALSEDAKKLLEYIKANLSGQKFTSVLAHFADGAGETIGPAGDTATYNKTHAAWSEIRRSGVKYSLDGKVFGFE